MQQMIKRLAALAAATAFFCLPALADQSSLQSPNTGTVTGLELTDNYNNALNALNTCNSGASAPTNQLSGVPSAGNCWLNTSTGAWMPLGYYDGSQWVSPGWIDSTDHIFINNTNVGPSTTIASASTTNLCASGGPYISISGTTTITSFGSSCPVGTLKQVVFQGALTLTHSSSLFLPAGGANITTASGDRAVFYYAGSGNWAAFSYNPASGQQVGQSAAQVLLATLGYGSSNFSGLQDTTHITSAYAHYMLNIQQCVPATSDNSIGMQLYLGGTLQTGGNYNSTYFDSGYVSAVATNVTGSGEFQLLRQNIKNYSGDGSSPGLSAKIYIDYPANTNMKKQVYWTGQYYAGSGGAPAVIFGSAFYSTSNAALTGFNLFANGSQNLQTCVIQIYGWN